MTFPDFYDQGSSARTVHRWGGSSWLLVCSVLLLGLTVALPAQAQKWHPADAPLLSRWGSEVSPETVKDRPYPRSQ